MGTRTLQTAQLTFKEATEVGVPCVAEEAWRETVNFCCDGRWPVSKLKCDFPSVDFSQIKDESDPIWAHYEQQFGDHVAFDGYRESGDLKGLAQRLRRAIASLAQRPERSIAVVTHNAILMHLFNMFSNPGIV